MRGVELSNSVLSCLGGHVGMQVAAKLTDAVVCLQTEDGIPPLTVRQLFNLSPEGRVGEADLFKPP